MVSANFLLRHLVSLLCIFILCQSVFFILSPLLSLLSPIALTYKKQVVEIAYNYLPKDEAAIFNGVIFGDGEGLTFLLKNKLKITGTIHIVVVSGYNISFLISLLITLVDMGGQKLSRLFKYVLSHLVIFLYLVLIGWGVAAIRAFLMSIIVRVLKVFGFKVNIYYVLALSVILMLGNNPKLINDVSCQFSSLSTLGLIMYGNKFSKLFFRFLKWLFGENSKSPLLTPIKLFGNYFCETVAASLLVIPLISSYFGTVSLVAPVVNGLVLWVVPYVTLVSPVALILAPVSHYLAFLSFKLAHYLLTFFLFIINYFSSLPFSSLFIRFNAFELFVSYFLVFSLYYLVKKYENT